MSLRLTCLGGAAAWPNPGQGCSSYLVESSGGATVLDAGSNTLLELRKHIDYREVSAIVISHFHSDHVLDLIPYRYGLTYGPVRPESRIPLWLPPGGRTILDTVANAIGGQAENAGPFWDEVFNRREYDPGTPLGIGDVTISFARTVHPAECYAMRIDAAGGSSIAYTADSGTVDSIAVLARGCDVLISEATMPEDSDRRGAEVGHLTPSQAGELAATAGVGTLVLAHLWSERPEHEVIEAAARSFSGPILIARPGLVVNA